MNYNAKLYNASQFNLTQFAQGCLEALVATDSDIVKDIFTRRTESQNTSDLLSDGATLAAFHETVNIYQHAYTAFSYNNSRYNWNMYNLRLDEDEILLRAIKALSDSQGSSDAITALSAIHMLADALSSSDVMFIQSGPTLYDYLFIGESFHIGISNKALPETIRVNDWLQIDKPFVEAWHD
jgi:hypothetical protein